ncbi:hypothetical protein PUNSTDRAFT_67471, partial [Punctularia strigosozonata HHB-11173 SS5]|uniref:uncharacterized protein n=1 Tax=Punctularia strigosozonata (strain HHB-11173) TaxID=741275 RepID=UPI0004416985
VFCAGAMLMILSAALRVACFRALGRLFTFEVTIRPSHRLKTHGPYSIVRHPSYTGVLFMLVGAAMVCYWRGSYVDVCGIWSTPPGKWIYVWYTCATFAVFSLVKRGRVKDKNLLEMFGRDWELYKADVPYSFIPWAY